MFSATLRNTWLLSAALRSTPQHSRAPASLVRWFAAESRGSSKVLRKGAENNDGAAQRITSVAGQTPVRRKQVYIFPEENRLLIRAPAIDPRHQCYFPQHQSFFEQHHRCFPQHHRCFPEIVLVCGENAGAAGRVVGALGPFLTL